MARPSKLTDRQWEKIGNRLLAGESAASLAREFKISKTAISSRFSKRNETVRATAGLIVAADNALSKLTITEQSAAFNLADELRSISTHLAGAAKYGAMTSHRLAGIANMQVDKIDESDISSSMASVEDIVKLTYASNEAAKSGFNLIKAHQDAINKMNEINEAGNAGKIRDITEEELIAIITGG